MIKNDKKFIIVMVGVVGVCYLIAFIITHIFGIEDIKVHTINHGDISMTTGIFFMIVLIPLILVGKYFNAFE